MSSPTGTLDGSIEHPNMCYVDYWKSSNFYIWNIAFIILVLSGVGYLFYKWIKNSNYFPLKERSIFLSQQGLIVCTMNIIVFPIIIVKESLDPEPYDCNSWFSYASRAVYTFARFSYTQIYLIKTIRIWFAFNMNATKNSFLYSIFKTEWKLGLAGFIISIGVTTLIALTNSLYLPIQVLNQAITWFWVYYGSIEIIILVSLMFLMRKVPKKYSIKEEILMMVFPLTTCIYFTMGAGTIDSYQNGYLTTNENYCSYVGLPLTIITMMKPIFIILIQSIYPLIIAQQIRIPLTPVIILQQDIEKFLTDDLCVRVFTQYLQHLDEKQYNQLSQVYEKSLESGSKKSYNEHSKNSKNSKKSRKSQKSTNSINHNHSNSDNSQIIESDDHIPERSNEYNNISEELYSKIRSYQKLLIIYMDSKMNQMKLDSPDYLKSTVFMEDLKFKSVIDELQIHSSNQPNQTIIQDIYKKSFDIYQTCLNELKFIYEQKFKKTKAYKELQQYLSKNEEYVFNMLKLDMTLLISDM